MLVIEGESIVDGDIVGNNLVLTKHNGGQIIAGPVVGPQGIQGPAGPAGGLIPGEIRMWPSGTLPELASYGKWVWADGAAYDVATYPIAASHIASAWKTFGGVADPGAGKFRVPDLRGLVPAGLDAMPGGSRANRMTRAVAIVIAAKTGEETHIVTVSEMPSHSHPVIDPGHVHSGTYASNGGGAPLPMVGGTDNTWGTFQTYSAQTGISLANSGGGVAHENVQPTVFVPYIVKMD
jgi:microcystin-dependent protein